MSRGLGDVYKRQVWGWWREDSGITWKLAVDILHGIPRQRVPESFKGQGRSADGDTQILRMVSARNRSDGYRGVIAVLEQNSDLGNLFIPRKVSSSHTF